MLCSTKEFPSGVEKSIQNLIAMEGFLTYDIYRQRILKTGSSYFGEVYEVGVNGKTQNGGKEIYLFLKIINAGEKTYWKFVAELYRIELFTYRELTEIFVALQEEANVPPHERFKMVKSYEDSSTEAIILENIAKKDYKICRAEVVPLELAEIAIKELAKLHGLSFALQENRPDYFNTDIKKMQYPTIITGDINEYLKTMVNFTMKFIDEDVKSIVEQAYYKLADKYALFFEDEATRRCICHGDYKSNNMMIKIKNEKVNDFIAVDYQFLHYGCPAMDIIFFIFLNTDQQFRKAHLSHLKDLYHEALTTFLGYFNIDVDLVYSREMFEQDFKAKLDYGLLVGFAILPLSLVNEVDTLDLTGDVTNLSFQVRDAYKDMQRGMIEEFTEWGYI